MNVMVIIVWLLYVICMVAIIYKTVKETRAIKTRRQVIDKTCEWLSKQGQDWWEGYGIPFTITDFKKAMEEE